jgi:hypothetical protein
MHLMRIWFWATVLHLAASRPRRIFWSLPFKTGCRFCFVLQKIAAVFVVLSVRRACKNYECYIELPKWTCNFHWIGHPCSKAKRNVIPVQTMIVHDKREIQCHSFLSYVFNSEEWSVLRSGLFKLRYLFQMRMDRRCGGVNNLLYWPGIEPWFLRHPAHTQVPIPTTLPCLQQL